MNWIRIFNRLFEIINLEGETYFSGPRFISKVREVDPYFHDYSQFMEHRKSSGKSTSRKDYFYDILLGFEESQRLEILHSIISDVSSAQPDKVKALQAEIGVSGAQAENIPDPLPPAQHAKPAKSQASQSPQSSPTNLIEQPKDKRKPALASKLSKFWLTHWQWLIGTAIAAAAVIAAFLE